MIHGSHHSNEPVIQANARYRDRPAARESGWPLMGDLSCIPEASLGKQGRGVTDGRALSRARHDETSV
jgi:hypothetical protein